MAQHFSNAGEKNCQFSILCEGKIKTFSEEENEKNWLPAKNSKRNFSMMELEEGNLEE